MKLQSPQQASRLLFAVCALNPGMRGMNQRRTTSGSICCEHTASASGSGFCFERRRGTSQGGIWPRYFIRMAHSLVSDFASYQKIEILVAGMSADL